MSDRTASWCGQSVERVEDAALLTGRGRFIDDLGVRPGTLHAAILRSPHAHANIKAIRTEAAARLAGVTAVFTGADIAKHSASLVVGVKAPIECWPIAVDRVRYVGEPVAIAIAESRYLAEDALDLIEVDYEPLAAVIDPIAALDPARSDPARSAALQSRERAQLPLRRSGTGFRQSRAHDFRHHPLSAQCLHADGDLRRRRRIRSRRGRL